MSHILNAADIVLIASKTPQNIGGPNIDFTWDVPVYSNGVTQVSTTLFTFPPGNYLVLVALLASAIAAMSFQMVNTLNVPVSLDPEQLINSAIGGIGQFYNQTAITTAKIRSIAGASNLLGSSYLVVYRVA